MSILDSPGMRQLIGQTMGFLDDDGEIDLEVKAMAALEDNDLRENSSRGSCPHDWSPAEAHTARESPINALSASGGVMPTARGPFIRRRKCRSVRDGRSRSVEPRAAETAPLSTSALRLLKKSMLNACPLILERIRAMMWLETALCGDFDLLVPVWGFTSLDVGFSRGCGCMNPLPPPRPLTLISAQRSIFQRCTDVRKSSCITPTRYTPHP